MVNNNKWSKNFVSFLLKSKSEERQLIIGSSVITEDLRLTLTILQDHFLKSSPRWSLKNVYFYFSGGWRKLYLKDTQHWMKVETFIENSRLHSPQTLGTLPYCRHLKCWLTLKNGFSFHLHADSKKVKYSNIRQRSRETFKPRV